jgi:HlyD family secretion protein
MIRARGDDSMAVTGGSGVNTLRLDGIVEAVEFVPIQAPKIAGETGSQLTITHLLPNSMRVRQGDLLVSFDPQQQREAARKKAAEADDLASQIGRKRVDLGAQDEKDASTLRKAMSDLALARLEILKNDMLPRLEVEKNRLALDAAEGTISHLREALALKHAAADLDIGILEARRDQLAAVARHAEQNAERMALRSPISGLVVYQPMWRGGQYGDPQEGLEVWPGRTVLIVVNPKTKRVRARVNQVDVQFLRVGMGASVRLDAYSYRTYRARLVEVTPVAITSQFSDRVRVFTALFTIDHADAALTPDLSASVEIER